MTRKPTARGVFLGNYQGLVAAGHRFGTLFVRTTGKRKNPTDVFFAWVRPDL